MGAATPMGHLGSVPQATIDALLELDTEKIEAVAKKKTELVALAGAKKKLMALAAKSDELLALLEKEQGASNQE